MNSKKVLIFLLIALSSFAFLVNAQEKDEFGNPLLKKLSEQDAMRIFGDQYAPKFFNKANGDQSLIKESIINGNKITTIVFNYASICAPNRLGNIADLVWNGLGYGFEFGPLAAAEVVGDSNQVLQIVSDSFIRDFQGDYSPDATVKWGWLPKQGFVDPNQDEIARLNIADSDGDGKPDSWPEEWYSEGAGKYVWPAFLGDQATAPDEEVYFVVDDFTNEEFPYYPFPSDRTKRGIGLDMAVRIIQFNNPLAEDIMFLVYSVTNASEKDLNRAYFGMHGDPHVGGPSDYGDDRAGFIDPSGFSLQDGQFPQRARSMVYSWDDDMKGAGGRPAGYFGWKFLESPANVTDNIDNDFDGITDESPFNNAGDFLDGTVNSLTPPYITDLAAYTAVYGAPKPRYYGDEDGDWNGDKDDIGIDGIGPDSPNYPGPDYGEGDGVPSQGWFTDLNDNGVYDPDLEVGTVQNLRGPGQLWAGSEPNFGLRDISESDQIGLTSFHAAVYTNALPNVPLNDPLMWEWLSADSISASQELLAEAGDNVFNFGTGPLSLEVGETQRFSMAILFGNDLQDLTLNAETSTKILEADYRFAQPPAKPIVSVVPGDGRVTLYWDTRAEESVDPLSGLKDFQGYKIYRSRDYTFSDVYTITDGKGNPFLGKPMAQFDLDDSLSGFHPVEYEGRAVKFWLGENTGLVHEYVDSTVTNGVNYYYAVVAYDSGTNEIPPSETQAIILRDAVTGELTFETNTAQVTPGPVGSGIKGAQAGVNGKPEQVVGNSTGELMIKILDELKVEDKIYTIDFISPSAYNVKDSTGVTEEFVSKDTIFVELDNQNLVASSVKVFTANGAPVPSSDLELNAAFGRIKGARRGALPAGEVFKVQYSYYPVFNSTLVNFEDANPSFNGIKVYVQNDPLAIDRDNTEFIGETETNIKDSIKTGAQLPGVFKNYRADWEIRWLNLDTLADGKWANVGDSALTTQFTPAVAPFNIVNTTENVKGEFLIQESIPALRGNGQWDFGETIVLRPTNAAGADVTYGVQFDLPKDSTVTPILPKAGDVYKITTTKPFASGDKYKFESKKAEFTSQDPAALMDDIYVVPNPYVGYSPAEEPGRTIGRRGERVLQFRNLPPTCTIRIYTITGELVQTINKDDQTSIATWDLLSFEGQRISYGVYIYHVDIPGVGEKIGRIGVIK